MKRKRNLRFRKLAGGSVSLRHLLGVGGWCWFSNPRALRFVGTNDKIYIGTIDVSGNLYVGQYDNNTNTYVHTLLTATLEADDHDNPSLFVRPSDNRLIAFYSKHSNDLLVRYKISTNPEDATSWGTEQTYSMALNNSYANPFTIASDSNACYVVSRTERSGGGFKWMFRRTTDYSDWGLEYNLWDTGAFQEYVQIIQNGADRCDFFASDKHPDNNSGSSSLYHWYCQWHAGTSTVKWYNSSGTEQTRPLNTTKATLIYNGVTDTQDGWTHDLSIDSNGLPRVLFMKRVSTTGTGDMRCMFSRWNGSTWTTPVEITAHGGYLYSGEQSYSGLACFDGADINKVYVSKQVSGIYEIQEFISSDNGVTWDFNRNITTATVSPNVSIRPFSPKNHAGKLSCLYNKGVYTSFTNSNMSTYTYPPI